MDLFNINQLPFFGLTRRKWGKSSCRTDNLNDILLFKSFNYFINVFPGATFPISALTFAWASL